MRYEAERKEIEGRFQSQWAASSFKDTPIIFENIPYKVERKKDYVAITIISGSGSNQQLGTNFIRSEGIIQFDILTLEESGTANARKMADVISDAFRNVRFGDATSGQILTRVPDIRSLGVEDGRFRLVVSVDFQRYLHLT